MPSRRLLSALAFVAFAAVGLELLARELAPLEAASAPRNSEGFRDREWKLERTPGVKRVALVGKGRIEALDRPFEESFARRLERRLARTEVLDMTGAPVEEALRAAARHRPDVVLLALEEPPFAWRCPSRALTFAVGRAHAIFSDDEETEDVGAVARTRELCEARETAASFGARLAVLVFPDETRRFERRALRSCDTAGVRAFVVRDDLLVALPDSLER